MAAAMGRSNLWSQLLAWGGGGDPALCAVTFDRRAGEWRGAAEEGVALAYLFTRPHVVREAPDATGSVSRALHARVSESASQVP